MHNMHSINSMHSPTRISMDTTRIHTRELVKIVLGMLCTRTVVCIQYSYFS